MNAALANGPARYSPWGVANESPMFGRQIAAKFALPSSPQGVPVESSEPQIGGETVHEDVVQDLGASRSCVGVVQAAEHLLQSRLDRTRKPSKYIAAFRTRRGRELALERSRKAIYLWIEAIPPKRTGLEIVNRDNPGMPYDDAKGRNSNLRAHAPRLAPGRQAHYVRVDDIGTLAELLRWYEVI